MASVTAAKDGEGWAASPSAATGAGAGSAPAAPSGAQPSASGLQQRLEARYNRALEQYEERVRRLNAEIDAAQQQRVADMKAFLDDGHAQAARVLAEETAAHEEHLRQLDAQQQRCAAPAPGTVLEPFSDVFFEPGDTDFKASKRLMRKERLRLLRVAVSLRDAYQGRLDCIAAAVAQMEEEELRRRNELEALLSALMLQLAKISYRSVTVSHVLVQRIIHRVNEQAAANHAGITQLLTKLSRREVLKQRQYAGAASALYSATLTRMSRSAALWLQTLLQSSHFRRPATRMTAVERVIGISGTTRREARLFLDALGGIVRSLRESREVSAEPLDCQLPCGGSRANGWLRAYDPDVHHPVFSGSPMDVVDEWRMKANVVVRNSQAGCVALGEQVSADEEALRRRSVALREELLRRTEWLFTPLEEEPELLLGASIGRDEQAIDDVFTPLVVKNMQAITLSHADIDGSVSGLLRAIQLECEWFASTIGGGLMRSHEVFESALLLTVSSVLNVFSRATESVADAASSAIGYVRDFHRRQYEALRDHEDRLAALEEQHTQLGDKLAHASTAAAGEELFAQGLLCLERIAAEHKQFHQQTVASLIGIGDRVDAHVGEVCGRLVRLVGLEAEHDTEERLALERQEKIDALIAQAGGGGGGGGGAGGKKKGGGKKGNAGGNSGVSAAAAAAAAAFAAAANDEESEVSRSSALASLLDEVPLEEVSYDQVDGPDGVTYNIVGPLAFAYEGSAPPAGSPAPSALPSPARTGGNRGAGGQSPATPQAASPAAGGSQKSGPARRGSVKKKGDSAAAAAAQKPADALDEAFVGYYSPMLVENVTDPENFITEEDVGEWMRGLRVEIAAWTAALRASSRSTLDHYCSQSREDFDRETNRILREHRRRPAAYQADLYEARVREIENETSSSEKYCARLRERVAKVEAASGQLHSNAAWIAEDQRVLEEMEQLRLKAGGAATAASLQVQERRFASLASQYAESFEQRCRKVVDGVEKQKEGIELECRHFLASRADELGAQELAAGQSLQDALDADPITQRVREILELLAATVASVRRFAEDEARSRGETVQSARDAYDAVYKQSMAELQLLGRIQEAFARLKAQVQSMVLLSSGEQDKLAEVIDSLEAKLSDPVPRPNLVPTMKLVTQKDYALETSKEAPVEEVPADAEAQLLEDLEHQLQSVRVALQRHVRACDASETLGIIDFLRGIMYRRGVALGALVCAVEMVRVSPDFYVEPKPMSAAQREEVAAAAAAAAAAGAGAGAKGARKSKGSRPSSVAPAAAPPTIDPLPTVMPYDTQLRQWVTAVKTEVMAVVQAHFSAYPPPLARRMPGMRGGAPEDIQAAVDAVCATQEDKAREHLADALRTFQHQTQRVYVALQAMPQYLAAAVFAVASVGVEKRVGCVMEAFGNFYSYSSAMKAMHRGVVKVSLGAKSGQERLAQLREAEGVRQEVTRAVLERCWGLVLRELQDEAGQHAARCTNTCNTFFHLLRGIPTPEHLSASDVDVAAGEHRGIRHLMRLRSTDGRLQDAERGAAVKERRLQETMPLLKQEVVAKNRERTAEGLPMPVYTQMDYKGLPLCNFRPLEQFNTDHPRAAAPAPLAAGAYYPVVVDGGTAAAGAGAGAAAAASSASGANAAKRGKKKSGTEAAAEEAGGVSPSFAVPPTRVHQETIALARESVHYFNHTAQEVTATVNTSFHSWIDREEQWDQTWALTIARLGSFGAPAK